MNNDEFYIKRCIELAQKALGKTYPNPLVGSVIVHNGKIIGEGYHHKAGENHAEINAINSVENKELIRNPLFMFPWNPAHTMEKRRPVL